jgi:ankyrin repeat protein
MENELDEELQYEIDWQLRQECYNLGNIKDILDLIRKGANIHHFDEESMSSPLSVAASMNNVELVEFFLKRGVSPKEHNNLALEEASRYYCLDTIPLLIKNGAIVKPDMFLNAYNAGNWEVAQYFIENFNIILSEQVLERIKNDDQSFFNEVNRIVKTRILHSDLSKELSCSEEVENNKKLKI